MNITILPDHTKFTPIGDKVLLSLVRVEPEKLTDVGGILVDQNTALRKSPLRETEVIAVGPECKQVQAGDTVLWNRLNAQPFPHGELDLYFLPENHLICVTKRAEPTTSRCVCRPADPALTGAPDEGTS